VKAAHAAWSCTTDESARALASRALTNEHVAFLVESYFGKDPEKVAFSRQAALDFAAKKARNSKDDKLALDYMKLIVAMEGWLVKPADKVQQPKHDDSNEEFTLD
jgi:hypothetical protein